jgi:excisionase family DNA binding protein
VINYIVQLSHVFVNIIYICRIFFPPIEYLVVALKEGLRSMKNNEKVNRSVLSVEEVRSQLGLSRSLMYDAVRSGQIPAIRIGRRILIPRTALEQLLNGTMPERTPNV